MNACICLFPALLYKALEAGHHCSSYQRCVFPNSGTNREGKTTRSKGASGRSSFLGQGGTATTESVRSESVTQRSGAEGQDFRFAEGLGAMSQEAESAKFLHQHSVTCNKNLALGPQMGTRLTVKPIKRCHSHLGKSPPPGTCLSGNLPSSLTPPFPSALNPAHYCSVSLT